MEATWQLASSQHSSNHAEFKWQVVCELGEVIIIWCLRNSFWLQMHCLHYRGICPVHSGRPHIESSIMNVSESARLKCRVSKSCRLFVDEVALHSNVSWIHIHRSQDSGGVEQVTLNIFMYEPFWWTFSYIQYLFNYSFHFYGINAWLSWSRLQSTALDWMSFLPANQYVCHFHNLNRITDDIGSPNKENLCNNIY